MAMATAPATLMMMAKATAKETAVAIIVTAAVAERVVMAGETLVAAAKVPSFHCRHHYLHCHCMDAMVNVRRLLAVGMRRLEGLF